jgi:tetratricopeptide (TPR) repeat protein
LAHKFADVDLSARRGIKFVSLGEGIEMRAGLIIGAILALAPSMTSADPEPDPTLGHICGGAEPASDPATPALATTLQPILTGYGSGGFAVRTSAPAAQAYFDNGMQLGHAFAHKPSIRAFQEAERLDPNCAMCAWGEAWASGPTINYTIDAKAQATLAALADKAAALAKDGPVKEQRLIAAMQKRYHKGGGGGAGDQAFAEAMDQLARDYPTDNEIAIVAADAWMIPASNNANRKNLSRALELIGGALSRKPDDTGAIHFYIHATEMDGIGGQAERYADTLQRLAPSASHLVHMPSHTYYIVGRYQDAVRANQDAAGIDIANASRQGLGGDPWKLTYHGHNVQFATGAALMSGDGPAALAQSQAALDHIATAKSLGSWDQIIGGTAYFAQGRFAEPAAVLALPQPTAADQGFLRAMWHYARGEALARKGDVAGVQAEAAQVTVTAADLKAFGSFAPQGAALAQVPQLVLNGRVAMMQGKPGLAAAAYRKAAEIQERKLREVSDPPIWWYPVRRSLAAALLADGKADEAATEARIVLKTWPNDPVTLAVLAQAERKLGDGKGADLHMAQARRGWHGRAALAAVSALPAA